MEQPEWTCKGGGKKLVAQRWPGWTVIIFGLIGLCNCTGDGPPGSRQKNFLLITLDTLRADHLGCYGYKKNTSPAIDSLASYSVVFDNAIAQSAVTPVSHASILTGLYPHNHELRSLHGGVGYKLAETRITLAEILKSSGYETGGFVGAFPVTKHYGLHQGFETWDEEFLIEDEARVLTDNGIVNTGRAQRRGEETTIRAIDWLEEHSNKPFFAWIHYFDIHDPLILPPKEYLAKFPPASRSQVDVMRAYYDSEISFVDAQVGRILEALEHIQVLDNTIIAVISDHGEGLGDHNWWGHSILYQEQIRLVFILSMPWRKEGCRIKSMVRSIDLLPTIVELLDLDMPSHCLFDGESQLELIDGAQGRTKFAFSESINDLTAYNGSPMQNQSLYAVTDGRWKFILHREGSRDVRYELFDLQVDPNELQDLSGLHFGEAERLREELKGINAILEDPPRPMMDEKTEERLRSLGYVK